MNLYEELIDTNRARCVNKGRIIIKPYAPRNENGGCLLFSW